jgi:cyclic pyranopterin phosphate synthase
VSEFRSLPVVADRAPALVDGFARRIRYLRVSVTDRCNYRCVYCMPAEGVELRARDEVLAFEELERLIRVFAALGVRRVRLTGGEPTVRKGVVDLVARVAAVPGIEAVVMTSNGHLLPDLAAPLAAAGLREVNVSLDTLDPVRFRAMTRRGELERVIAGIDAARAAGLKVKLNAVALRGVNDDEVAAICAWAWARGITPRFIEHMPMSDGAVYAAGAHLPAAAIRAAVEAAFGGPLVAREGAPTEGPARVLALPDGRALGIISAMSEHFCATCNRLRLTSTGELHTCLGHDDATDLRTLLRGGAPDADLRDAIVRAVAGKREGHTFRLDGAGGPRKHMIAIGG